MKIGLFGGSFDPVHLGHEYAAKIALSRLDLQQIWVIPTAQNPLKKNVASNYQKRLELCVAAFRRHPKILVKDFENHSVSTYNLVRFLRKKYPRDQFFWIMGQDSFETLPKWKNYKKLLKIVPFVVVSREIKARFERGRKMGFGFDFVRRASNEENVSHKTFDENENIAKNTKKLPQIIFLRNKNFDISSSEIRLKKENL